MCSVDSRWSCERNLGPDEGDWINSVFCIPRKSEFRARNDESGVSDLHGTTECTAGSRMWDCSCHLKTSI